jgi:basic amino acid/polyamine antiporter, APA family
VPVFALIGGLGTATSWAVVTVLNFETFVAGTIWLTLGVTTYILYRRHRGLSLTETHKIVLPQPAVEHEIEYESVLVAFEDRYYSPETVSTAVRLAARRRRGIHVLVTITVPPNAPIDADTPEQEARAASILDSARVQGGRRVTGHWEKVRPGQAGRRIAEEAREIRARALVMSLPPRRTGKSLFGKTLETLLAERPCRIIIDSSRGLEKNGRAATTPDAQVRS